jgi:methylated-DNA-protein-cysteine methyltransferase related protein
MEEKENLFAQIKKQVAKIPLGKVSTYGEVAKSLGINDARKVGWAIYGNQDKNVPCHRVVNMSGYVAERFSLGGWQEHKARLAAEGIDFVEEKKVNMEKHFFAFK